MSAELKAIVPESINEGEGWDYPSLCADLALALVATREQIEEWDRETDPHGWWHERSRLIALFNAARRVAEADETWWCEEHRRVAGSEPYEGYAICWFAANALALDQRAKVERCRVVARLLLPAEEEK